MDNMTAKVSCFAIEEHFNNAAMTEQYFAAYNARTPQHPITAPAGVGYVPAGKKLTENCDLQVEISE